MATHSPSVAYGASSLPEGALLELLANIYNFAVIENEKHLCYNIAIERKRTDVPPQQILQYYL